MPKKPFHTIGPFEIKDRESARQVMQWALEHLKGRKTTKDELRAAVKFSKRPDRKGFHTFRIRKLIEAEVKFYPAYTLVGTIEVSSPSLRQQIGLGTVLMEAIEREARKRKCERIELVADRPEEGESHPFYFYRKLGFVPVKGQDVKRQLKEDDSVEMVKLL